MDKRGNLQNVGYPVFFTPGAIAKLSFICDGEVTFLHHEIKKRARRSVFNYLFKHVNLSLVKILNPSFS